MNFAQRRLDSAAHTAINAILLSVHVGSTARDVNDAVEKIHALRYPTRCPGGGCEFCVARLARLR